MQAPRIDALIESRGGLVIDGGLATQLEHRGFDLNHELWSAKLLLTNPQAICDVHRSFLDAGAQIITTASYQASIRGLCANGLTENEAQKLLADSVFIAQRACQEFADGHQQAPDVERDVPLVAASVGPYGAFLADGSEYRGNYGVSRADLETFHRERIDILCHAKPDLLACETIPCFDEAVVLREVLGKQTDIAAWISFSCRDETRISDGTPLQQCAELFEECPQVFAVGVNCTAPQYIPSLIKAVNAGAPSKRIVVYPNSGQEYDAKNRTWKGQSSAERFGEMAGEWLKAGATLIGGCCQTGPQHIEQICNSVREF